MRRFLLFLFFVALLFGLDQYIKNIFVAGDGAGISRDITNAAATGILAARGILKKEGICNDADFKKEGNWREKINGL